MTAVTMSDKPGAAATNQSPPNPSRCNETRPAGGWRCVCVCVWECISIYICVCSKSLKGRREEGRILKRLEIYWLPFAVSLLLSLLSASMGLPFSASLFIEGCRGLCFGSAVCYRLFVTHLLLKRNSRGLLSAPASASVYGKENMKAISSCIKQPHFSFNLYKCSMMSRTAALWTTVKCKYSVSMTQDAPCFSCCDGYEKQQTAVM